MAIPVECYGCCAEMTEPGTLLFEPPLSMGYRREMPMCGECWRKIRRFIRYGMSESTVRVHYDLTGEPIEETT